MNMDNNTAIFVIEDEKDLGQLICSTLEKYHFSVSYFPDGQSVLRELDKSQPDICIVDLNLPDIDGMQLVKRLDSKGIGVIVVSGRDELADRVLGLEFGADDYITKPFEPRELVARVQSLSRRISKNNELGTNPTSAQFEDWVFQPDSLTLINISQNTEESLSRVEGNMLLALTQNPFKILSRNQLLGENYAPYDRSIDVRVSRLRKKLEKDPQKPKLIKTIYGAGYMFTTQVKWA